MTIQKEKRALIPETVWLSSNALDAIDDFQPTSGRECAAWLFGRRFPTGSRFTRSTAGSEANHGVSCFPAIRSSSCATRTTGCSWSVTCTPTLPTPTQAPRTNGHGRVMRANLAGRSSA
jgi:hypothetical protein